MTDNEKTQASQAPFEINFPTFILSLASSIQISLGMIPHPANNKPQVNLTSAKQTIDILGMLEEKTKGNLSDDEKKLLTQILYELRIQYVEVSERKQS
ncbi:MAG: hypothetical protein A3G32_03610 [Deltaproteobacteria bacterium RIFCSPLOWO2_12_FULL_40_28]|nr:MAG: hypothetical protein A3C45_05495 [Deltaproteobacteria bacterium RIFCSPHIGHO2_02_FULL_40_28]OGQ19409.1 MAG: hypothetical protein A3E27_06125 [Deltaproteobacteria bacterium RIFCSPHIGHO2_12_FULL_40_32]OGQ39853.1 MAG: hypothetical protein A3I69_07090 [Deltaproteobacteria bacterium RIFCSPLOWO2_02_FULL_40_36]OGQ53847.1 MAG: hypothetical protein A3G32_03610 [Deltaproteobacteria bacterium RIFCSPLOWO2_12_FULL_40_28]